MNHSRFLTAVCAALVPFAVLVIGSGCSGCNKDEDVPPPTPSAAPTPEPTPAPTPTPLVVEEDAGSDAADDADADAGKKVVGNYDSTGIKACCNALRQNANSAPLDQKGTYLSAAGVCDGLVNSPQGRQALSAVRGMLKGANMPSSCQ